MVNMDKFRNAYTTPEYVKIKTEDHICHTLVQWYGTRALLSSGISSGVGFTQDGKKVFLCNEKVLKEFFAGKLVKYCLEVGTYLGVMSLILSRYCQKVSTVDILPRTDALALWDRYGADVTYNVSNDQSEIDKYVKALDFDFAYVDADHTYESVKHDFSLVKKCGRVLFHDYYTKHHPGIKKFIDELPEEELTFFDPFVYWEKK